MAGLSIEDLHTKGQCYDIIRGGAFGFIKEGLVEKRERFETPEIKGSSFNQKYEYGEDDTVVMDPKNPQSEFKEQSLYEDSTTDLLLKKKDIHALFGSILKHMGFIESHAFGKVNVTTSDGANEQLDMLKPSHLEPMATIKFTTYYDGKEEISAKLYDFKKANLSNNVEELKDKISAFAKTPHGNDVDPEGIHAYLDAFNSLISERTSHIKSRAN